MCVCNVCDQGHQLPSTYVHFIEPNEKKMQVILDAWLESARDRIPGYINADRLLNVLRSSNVGLRDVAEDLEKVCRLHAVCSGLGCTCIE